MIHHKEKRECIVILGLEEQGLALLQCMAKTHQNVHYFIDGQKKGRFRGKTRLGREHLFSSIEDLDHQLHELQSLFDRRLNIFITSATLLTDIRLSYRSLYEEFRIWSYPLSQVDLLSTKNSMYDYALTRGLNTPRYKLLTEYQDGMLRFPVVLKRNIEHYLSFKTFIANNKNEFDSFVDSIKDLDDASDIIVQEMVPSCESKDYSFHGFAFNGIILGGISFEEVRHHPTGISSYLEELDDVKSLRLLGETTRLLEKSEYSGFFQIDFKYDGTSDKLFIMDVNTRPPGSHSAFRHKFLNWRSFYTSLCEKPIELIPRHNKIQWINIIRDYLATHKDHLPGSTLKCALQSHWDVFDWYDPLPFIHSIYQLFQQKIDNHLFHHSYEKVPEQ